MEISGAGFNGLFDDGVVPLNVLNSFCVHVYVYMFEELESSINEAMNFAGPRVTEIYGPVHIVFFWCFNIGPWQKGFKFLALSDHGHPHLKEGSLFLTCELNLQVYVLSVAPWNLCWYIDGILACPWVQYGDWWIFHGWCILPIIFF